MSSTFSWVIRGLLSLCALGFLRGQVPPTSVSVSPSGQTSSVGQTQTFTFTYSDTNSGGGSAISWVEADIGSSLGTLNSCFFIVNMSPNPALTLMGDNGSWSATMSNSQCSILGSPSVQVSGSNLIVTVPITFSSSYQGPQNIYMIAGNPYGTWQEMGTWTVSANTTSWYNGAWAYRQPITIAHGQVSGSSNLAHFPVLISITDSNLAASAQASGVDIIFTSSDGVSKLNHEIEKYSLSTGFLQAWVNIPLLSPTTDTVIYMYYGNASVPNQQNPWGSWDSNFAAVYHFHSTSDLTANDSTSNGNNGTNSGATPTAGIAGGAASFNGSSSSISLGDASSLQITGPITMSAWANVTSFPPANPYPTNLAYIIGKGYDGTSEGYDLRLNNYGQPSLQLEAGSYQYPAGYSALWPVSGWNANTWHHVVGTFDGANWNVYLDGVLKASHGGTSGALASSVGVFLGAQSITGALQRFWSGSLDEVRISNVARSASWIATEYNSQNAPGSFSSVGSQQTSPGGGTVATPSINPSGGTYSSPQTVSINTTTSGASIVYTTNGTTPSPANGFTYSSPFTVSSTTTIQAIAFKSGMSNSSVASATDVIQGQQPLTLPSSLKGITYFPPGHAFYRMFYDWYTSNGSGGYTYASDCNGSLLPTCSNTTTIHAIVQTDLQRLSQQGFNFIHLYLWDSNNTGGTGAGFSPESPSSSGNYQWYALNDFVSLAKQNNFYVMLHFVAGDITDGSAYATWVSQFITYLAGYQNVLIWGFGFEDLGTISENGQFWQNAYTGILQTLQANAYPSNAPLPGRALIAVDAGFDGFHTAQESLGQYIANQTNIINDVLPGSNTNTIPPSLPYTGPLPYAHVWTWQFAQQQADSLKLLGIVPDLYAIQLWNASGGDLEMNLQCLSGNTISGLSLCSTTTPVQTCNEPGGSCTTIPMAKLVVTEFAAGSSFESSPIGNRTASSLDAQEPTTTASGQAQWLTDTLCVFNAAHISYYAYFGLYDSPEFWANQPYDYDASDLAKNGYWGLSSELATYGDKPARNALVNFNSNNCPAPATTPLTPVLALLADAPAYISGDTAAISYTAANVSTLTMNGTPAPPYQSLPSLSLITGEQLSASSLEGSAGYTLVQVSANTPTLTLNGVNNNVSGLQVSASTSATASLTLTFISAPMVTTLVDYSTGHYCNFTLNPSCMFTISQTDVLEVFGEGFDRSGGNTMEIVNNATQAVTWLYENNPVTNPSPYFADNFSPTQMNAALGCFVAPGASTLYIRNPNSGNPSAGVAINITASSSCP